MSRTLQFAAIGSVFLSGAFSAGRVNAEELPEASQTTALTPEAEDYFESSVRTVLVDKCESCHSPDDEDNVVRFLEATSAAGLNKDRSLWHSVAEQLRNRTMPPGDEEQPSEDDRMRVADWIERTLRSTACDLGPSAGAVTVRRLNRTEYDRTITHLFGLTLNLADSFPVDGSGGEGFDNNGETLFLPPLLMERYVATAQEVLDRAIISPKVSLQLRANQLLPPTEKRGSRTVRDDGELTHLLPVYVAGRRTVRVWMPPTEAKSGGQLVLKVDGLPAERFDLTTTEEDRARERKSAKKSKRETRPFPPRVRTAELRLGRGLHSLSLRSSDGRPIKVDSVSIWSDEPDRSDRRLAAHRRVLGVEPGKEPKTAGPAARRQAREAISTFTRRAYRRPVVDEDVERLMALYDRAAERGDPWIECVKLSLKAALVSPSFLFRQETRHTEPGMHLVPDHELAVRLSYFLWSGPPDAELNELADNGRLNDPAVLKRQVVRMLDDKRSSVMAEQFISQWLGTREVAGRKAPDTSTFRGQFTTKLLLDMKQEPKVLMDHLVRNDRPLTDLIAADYMLLSPRLATHYGVVARKDKGKPEWPWTPDPQGTPADQWQRFEVTDGRRGGVLGMGGVHLVTSYPNRTSPVLRGGWILETLLGVKVPSPPPDVPSLRTKKKGKAVSVREALAEHRKNPACAACHNLMDPLGFALENFDPIGRWREHEHEGEMKNKKKVEDVGPKVDASAALPSGEAFEGPVGLRNVLLARKDQFRRHLVEKMLGYALGRSLTDRDDCTIDRISEAVVAREDSARALIEEVVLSVPFRFADGEPDAVASKNDNRPAEETER